MFGSSSSQLPDFSIHDRAGEMRITVAAFPDLLVLSHEQVSLVKRFHGYVFKHVLKLGKTPGGSVLSFDLEAATDGCLVVLLKNAESTSHVGASCDGTVAFQFIRELEKSLEDFEDPKDPSPAGLQDFEIYRHKVLVSTYTKKRSLYYTVDICYDRSPMDAFPSPEIAASFKEYYDARYSVNVSPNQPLLDVGHISMRLNFLVPRYQDTKGKDLTLPGKDPKRVQKTKVYLIPELCSIHPIPAYLWGRISNLPTILYRMESLLLAEELRSTIAREAGVGSVEWPSDVPLPPLTAGELVGESFELLTAAQDTKNAKDPGQDYVTVTSIEHETKKRPQELPVETRVEGLGASAQSRSSDAFCESSHTLITTANRKQETCSHSTRNEDCDDCGMAAKREDFRERTPRPQGSCGLCSETACSAEEEASVNQHVPATCDSGISLDQQVSEVLTTPDTAQQVEGEKVEKVSRLTVKNSEHSQEESSVSHSKAGGGSDDTSPDPPLKYDSGVSLSPDSLQASAILTEGGTDQQAEKVPLENVTGGASMFAPHGPPCTLVLRALTCSGAGEMFSLERLEMYGDSFVKYVISSELFHKYPHENEGKLSFIRGLRVSNMQLFYLGRRRDIPAYLFTRVFHPATAWIPPGFCVDAEENQTFSLMNLTAAQDANEDEEDEEGTYFVDQAKEVTAETSRRASLLNPYLHQVVSDKLVADATEALVGAYLLCCGPEGAIRLLSWLGMEFSFHKKEGDVSCSQEDVGHVSSATAGSEGAVDKDFTLQKLTSEVGSFCIDNKVSRVSGYDEQRQHGRPSAFTRQAAPTQDTLKHVEHSLEQEFREVEDSLADVHPPKEEFQEIEDSLNHVEHVDVHSVEQEFQGVQKSLRHVDRDDADSLQQEFQEVEKSLKYVFTDKSLLLQAFTHSSYPREYSAVKSSYEQLEFLGDALMDFLLTRHLYLHQRDKDPGFMTDLRSALVNNYIFASLAVRCGFHRHLRAMSPPLFKIVHEFVIKQEEAEREKKPSNPDQVIKTILFVC